MRGANRCDEIVRLIDQALAEYAIAGSHLPGHSHPTTSGTWAPRVASGALPTAVSTPFSDMRGRSRVL